MAMSERVEFYASPDTCHGQAFRTLMLRPKLVL